KKVYFPRLILPLSTAVTPLVDFCFAFLVLIGMMVYFQYTPTLLGIVMLPVLLLISLLSASGLGFFLASVNVKFRDVRHILPFFIQILLFVTPVIYPLSIISEKYHWIMSLNPMTGVISFARATLLGQGSVDWLQLGFSAVIGLIIITLGIAYFRKAERFFADIL
ncbi:MAG: ABC transporter permease, partial [Patescibacteria group bacterium]